MEISQKIQMLTNKSYFTVEELCKSDTAKKLGIDNTPPADIVEHLKELIVFLNPIREKWGSAIKVTSGYRCQMLNEAVSGSVNSAHLFGFAVDIYPKKGTIEDLYKFILNYLRENNLKWDQLIFEKSKTSKWIHFGLKSKYGKQRQQYFNLDV